MNSTSRVFSRLFIIVIFIKIFDVFKNLVIASVLGVSSSADIYTALISIPDSLIVLIGLDTIKGVVNSEYASLQKEDEKNLIWNSFNNLFNILFYAGVIVVSVILIFNSAVIKILLPGFEGDKFLKAIEISYIIFPILFKDIHRLFSFGLQRLKEVLPSCYRTCNYRDCAVNCRADPIL
ncbi:MAG: hypothetical protein IPM96_20950 [Ignavibacteria bacterium]|nr:hypothetical protein [Ignavibacteria bacterium]